MVEELEIVSAGRLLHVKVTGKLTKEAYEIFTPAVDEQIQEHGKLRILLEMHDFHGWTACAFVEDLKFDVKHWKDIERLAIVGESKWKVGHGPILFGALLAVPFCAFCLLFLEAFYAGLLAGSELGRVARRESLPTARARRPAGTKSAQLPTRLEASIFRCAPSAHPHRPFRRNRSRSSRTCEALASCRSRVRSACTR